MRQKWEYRTIKTRTTGWVGGKLNVEEFDRLLNELGRDGWELVALVDTNEAYGQTRDVVATFKRPLSS